MSYSAQSVVQSQRKQWNKVLLYAQFPFGVVDYKGLKQLQAHHESVHEKHITTEEMEWFKICRSTFSSHKPVYVSKLQALEAYFQDKVWTKTISEKGR